MSKLTFYYAVLGIAIILNDGFCLQAFCLLFFLFSVYIEKDIRRYWCKPPYIGLHIDQQPREPNYQKTAESI